MAKIDQGILGGYSGRIGNVVGYYRMGKWCIRAYQPTINDAKSEAQLRQRSLFKTMIQFASQSLAPIRLGFKQAADREDITECNLFMRINNLSFKHLHGSVDIDYPSLQFSMGDLPGVQFSNLSVDPDGRVSADYEPNRTSSRTKMDDQVHLYAYLPAKRLGILCAPAARRDKHIAFLLPDGWASQEVHFYAFTLAHDGSASHTSYLGSTIAPLSKPDYNKPNTQENKSPITHEERTTHPLPRTHRGRNNDPLPPRGQP